MKAAITGITGLIGTRLSTRLKELKWEVIPLTRQELSRDDSHISTLIDGCDVLINLAGAPILKRHTSEYKKEIYESRINTTLKLVNAIKITANPPKQFISASAVGIYSGVGVNTEAHYTYAADFMAQVVFDWEQAAGQAEPYTKVALPRQGIVLDRERSALQQMLIPFRLGLGATVGNGTQMFSWIHMDDLINAYLFLINGETSGVYNFTSPGYLRNADYTQVLAQTLNRPAFFSIPKLALKLVYGGAAETLTSGQAVYPERLLNEGFQFKYPIVEDALKDLVD